MKKFVLPGLIVLMTLLAGACAKKPAPEFEGPDISSLEAERSIVIAQSEISEAKEVGADVSEPEQLIEKARNFFSSEDYASALREANRAREQAVRLKSEILTRDRSRDDARMAIEEAQNLLSEVKEVGGDEEEPEGYVDRAKGEFASNNYPRATELADRSSDISRNILASISYKKIYTVGSWETDRDCLWNIAARKDIYDDPWKWKRIYSANSDKIEDPDIIYPGQKFIIPRD